MCPTLRFAQYSLLITLRDAGYCTPHADEKTGLGVTFKVPRANARPRTDSLISVAPGAAFFPLPEAGCPVSSLLCGHQDSVVLTVVGLPSLPTVLFLGLSSLFPGEGQEQPQEALGRPVGWGGVWESGALLRPWGTASVSRCQL